MLEMLLPFVLVFAVMYFLMIRPQSKRLREQQEMQAALAVGDRVLLTSGFFGTISYVADKQVVVELAPGTEVTVLKGAISRLAGENEEEFEFTDESAIDQAAEVADEVSVTAHDAELAEGQPAPSTEDK